jgi:hypothetical protein
MTPRDLKRALRNIRAEERGIHPDAAWVSRTRGELLARVSKEAMARSLPWTERISLAVRTLVAPRPVTLALRAPAMVFASVATLFMGGSFLGVQAAERAVPGDFFYPMKLAVEQTRLVFTKDKADRLKLKTEYVTRRIKEIKTLASNDATGHPERIKEAAELLKRDLDTVKTQLHEVQAESSPTQAATVAKAVDQASSEVAFELKTVKANVPVDVKIKVSEAQAAAVNTGVKAVQILLDTHDKPETKNVVTREELTQSLQGKVDGLKDNLQDATQKLLAATASSTSVTVVTSTLDLLTPSSSLRQIKTVETSLEETKQLIQENKLDEVKTKLAESASAIGAMETSAENLALTTANASSTTPPAPASTTSTTDLPTPTSTSPAMK